MTSAGPNSRVIGVLLDVARTLESSAGSRGRLAHTLELLGQLVPYNRCALLEALPGGDHDVVAVPAMSDHDRQRLTKKLLSLLHLITEDEELAGGNGGNGDPNVGVHLGLPLIAMDQTLGVLFVERDSDEPFGEESLRLLSLVAAHLGAYLATLQSSAALARSVEFQHLLIGRVSHDLRATNLLDILRTLIDEFRLSHPDRAIDFEEPKEDVPGEWDPDRLTQALTSLLTNALRYSPPTSRVAVALDVSDSHAVVSAHSTAEDGTTFAMTLPRQAARLKRP